MPVPVRTPHAPTRQVRNSLNVKRVIAVKIVITVKRLLLNVEHF